MVGGENKPFLFNKKKVVKAQEKFEGAMTTTLTSSKQVLNEDPSVLLVRYTPTNNMSRVYKITMSIKIFHIGH